MFILLFKPSMPRYFLELLYIHQGEGGHTLVHFYPIYARLWCAVCLLYEEQHEQQVAYGILY